MGNLVPQDFGNALGGYCNFVMKTNKVFQYEDSEFMAEKLKDFTKELGMHLVTAMPPIQFASGLIGIHLVIAESHIIPYIYPCGRWYFDIFTCGKKVDFPVAVRFLTTAFGATHFSHPVEDLVGIGMLEEQGPENVELFPVEQYATAV